MNLSKISQTELNLSVVADGIVTNAGIVSYHLFCPFCADFYLFEFTLKDHLKREHSSLIQKHFKNVCSNESQLNASNSDESFRVRFLNEFNHVCDLCGAMFKNAGLIPKHIINYHGTNCFAIWRQQQPKTTKKHSTSAENIFETSKNDPKEAYTKCSPDTIDMFDGITAHDDFTFDKTPKSILKKSTSKSARIINSPSSSCIRRIKNSTSVRRASSAKRILRFDIANTSPLDLENLNMGNIKLNDDDCGNIRKAKKSVGKLFRRILFGRCASKRQKNTTSNYYMVTNKELNLIDDVI